MKFKTIVRLTTGCMISVALLIAGCGGGGSSTGANPPATFVTGTASEGALIKGKTVKLKDATGKSAPDTTSDATTGIYRINVTGLTAPFLMTVTGTNGTYLSLAQTAGTANINPITTTVVALAAGTSYTTALFANLKAADVTTISANYGTQATAVTTALQAVLPSGVKASDYFTGTIEAGKGMDTLFDSYRITVNPGSGITIMTNDASSTTVLTVPTVTGSTVLPVVVLPAPIYTQAILKLKTVGALANGKQVGGWQLTVKMPANGISIKTQSATDKALDAAAFLKSGVTPNSFTFVGSFNTPDASSSVPYVMVSNLGNTSDLLMGTAVGEVATLIFDIAAGTSAPTKSDFVLTGATIAEAVVGVPVLSGVILDFDISYR